MTRIYKASAKYTFQVGTDKGNILVDANNRATARKSAEKAGFVVRDVNLI